MSDSSEVHHDTLSNTLLTKLNSEIASGNLKLPAKEWARPLSFRKTEGRTSTSELKNSVMKRAAYGQATGKELLHHLWCQTCASGRGLFTSCIVADDGAELLANGACMGCMYHGHSGRCSFNSEDGSLPRFIMNYAQSLGRGAIITTPKKSNGQKRKTGSNDLTTPTKAMKSSKNGTPSSAANTQYDFEGMTIDDIPSMIELRKNLQDDLTRLDVRMGELSAMQDDA